MTIPRASVVIPTFDRAALVVRAIESCLRQTVHDIEVIVVDDGSTDGTAVSVARYTHDRVLYVKQSNQRQGAARNTGIARAASEWVMFLDSDDEYLPEKIEVDLRVAAEHPEAVLIHGGMLKVGGGGATLGTYFPPRTTSLRQMVLSNPIVGGTVAAKRTMLTAIGGFRTERDLAGSEDWELWMRVSARHPLHATGGAYLVRHLETSSMQADPSNMRRSMRLALGLAMRDTEVQRRAGDLRRKAEARVELASASGFATTGKRRQSVHHLVAALRGDVGVLGKFEFWYALARAAAGARTFRTRRS